MKNLAEMQNWTYREAHEYFEKDRKNYSEIREYLKDLKLVPTIDLRNLQKKSDAVEEIIESINNRTFILIDGASQNGKTTFAKRLAKKVDGIVLDIDWLCKEWIDQELIKAKDQVEYFKIVSNMGPLTDEYLLRELENIICQKSKMNKPVILVGMYLDLIFRTIIFRSFGQRYFKKIVSILCFEDSFEKVEYFIERRKKKFDVITAPGERERCLAQYNIVRDIVNNQDGSFLGLGVDNSFIINSDISNNFES